MSRGSQKANDDPLAFARFLEQQDLFEIWELQYRHNKDRQRGLSLSEFFDLTSYQLFRTVFKLRKSDKAIDWHHDPVALIRLVNERRAERGEYPEIPPHILTDLPRG